MKFICFCSFFEKGFDSYQCVMGKQSLAEAKRKMIDSYNEKRKKEKKEDMNFPANSDELQRHIVDTEAKLKEFVDRYVRFADKMMKTRNACFVVLDVEGYTVDRRLTSLPMPAQWSWHEQWLKQGGISPGELERRKEVQLMMRKEWAKLSLSERVEQFWSRRLDMKIQGILPGDVMGISVAAVDDYSGDLSFAINCRAFVDKEYGGRPKLPEFFWRFLSHQAIAVINVGAYGDIENLVNSFWSEDMVRPAINYIEASVFFREAWSERGQPDRGLLSIVEEAFPGKTFFKSPAVTLSHWWEMSWKSFQIKYILNDVFFLAMAITQELERGLSFDVNDVVFFFPDKQAPLAGIDWGSLSHMSATENASSGSPKSSPMGRFL